MEEVAYTVAYSAMTEADYLRAVIVWCFSALGVLLTVLAGILLAVYKKDMREMHEKAGEERDESYRARTELTNALNALKQALFDEGRDWRKLTETMDRRILRLEWHYERRKGDRPSDDEPHP